MWKKKLVIIMKADPINWLEIELQCTNLVNQSLLEVTHNLHLT